MKKLDRAINLATTLHSGQYRWDGTPYILHPLRVLFKLIDKGIEDEDILCAAVLHDTVEDTNITLGEIRDWYGENVFEIVGLLTHLKGQSYEDYIKGVLLNKDACLIKLADIEDNSFIGGQLGTNASDEKIGKRYAKYLEAYNLIKESLGENS